MPVLVGKGTVPPIADFAVKGVLAIGRKQGLKLPFDSLPTGFKTRGHLTMCGWWWIHPKSDSVDAAKAAEIDDIDEASASTPSLNEGKHTDGTAWPSRAAGARKPRVIMYHGTGTDPNRTPSAWIDGHSNKVLLRVSSQHSDDHGTASIGHIVSGRWTHICIVARNLTDDAMLKHGTHTASNASGGRPDYSMSLYLDGATDVVATFVD